MAFNWFKKKKDKTAKSEAPDKPDEEAAESPRTDDIADEAFHEPEAPIDEVIEPQAAAERRDNLQVPKEEAASPPPPGDDAPAEKKGKGLFTRLKSGLSKTHKILTTDIDDLFLGKKLVDDDMLEDLEELLITADMGVRTTMDIMERIAGKRSRIAGAKELKAVLKEEILAYFDVPPGQAAETVAKPHVVMVVGVNGVGKTTTIGKLAAHESRQGKKVLIAAADTFRAAAIEQMAIWAERAGADLVRHKDNADPAAVAYDGVDAAISRGTDIVFVDTAGRLHTKVNLMEEIKKIQRTLAKRLPDAPHEVLLVLDATTGQNALSQAKMFNEALGVTGIALTKLDGTAKGGIVVSICSSLNIPLKYIGVGESVEDLQAFDPKQFVEALF
ncbi:signal recognition particle-docking protein FtsY [Desulfosarcina sp.]|uniref:signal recognition particle-docking protein FtsY n=1 Tax=Desulfosarcina sp. TaxID=2027861 RepID=UPI0029A3A960|nr:signal recognition particle-docking protein FtsY [Desulfosarcina sp.]MDX2454208.1 signal recognition particle-docking protein FtsY [Desulfosarcina sp.]MDX2491880.1 signal recognition particle-docking protein FtsY [Desulfosarcina sp.]